MLELNHDTVDDNATVKVITVVTLIYLPSSFVCVSLAFCYFCLPPWHNGPFSLFSLFEYFFTRIITTWLVWSLILGSSPSWAWTSSLSRHQIAPNSQYPRTFGYSSCWHCLWRSWRWHPGMFVAREDQRKGRIRHWSKMMPKRIINCSTYGAGWIANWDIFGWSLGSIAR